MDNLPRLTADDIHNWSASYKQLRWAGKLTPHQRALVSAAEYRHHQRGTSASVEAAALNRDFGWEE